MIIDPYTWQELRITEIVPVADATVAVRFKRPTAYAFRAGQYAVVRITKTGNQQAIRQYSFSSAPGDPVLELLIQREPGGEASNWFYDTAKSGDVVELSQPFGSFIVNNPTRPLLFIAGRVGIAPFLSMLRARPKQPTHLLYSVRNEAQVCFADELPRFDTTIITTDLSPRISAEDIAPLVTNKPLVYLCGSKQFVDAMGDLLLKMGVDNADTHRELFTLQ